MYRPTTVAAPAGGWHPAARLTCETGNFKTVDTARAPSSRIAAIWRARALARELNAKRNARIARAAKR